MENFDELQSLWNKQSGSRINTTTSDLIRKAEVNMKRVKIGQFLTIGILSTLTTILIGYFIWVGAYRLNALTIGLGMMISVIIVRIMLELISVNKLKRIKPDSSVIEFSNRIARFYTWRRKIHVIFIPIIYISYTAGFAFLLPSFREKLSPGMYLYVLISGFGSLTFLAFFIARKIKKETTLLNLLRSIKN
jgi:hypothetical protein